MSTSDREGVDALDVLLDDDGKVEAESKIDIETKRGTEEEAANQSEPGKGKSTREAGQGRATRKAAAHFPNQV